MPETRHAGSGKVRELYEVGDDQLLLVASDRISAYDVVLAQPIPQKGKVLTGLSAYWLELTDVPHHMISIAATDLPFVGEQDMAGRAMLCKRVEPILIEFVVRGYLAGSGWREYVSTGRVCGHGLPEGLEESTELPEPLLTPATKAVSGHDENITEARAAEIAGAEDYERARDYALRIYSHAARLGAERGVIIADTKFEFGVDGAGEVLLIDEVLTPDSSRFWPADSYRPGGSQPSFDKQYVRDWLDEQGWDHTPPPPDLPVEVVNAASQRYLEAYERLTGEPFAHWLRRADAPADA